MNNQIPFSVVLLAGGKGTRMQSERPKQFLNMCGKAVALYSFEVLAAMPEVQELVIVCEEHYREIFKDSPLAKHFSLAFALPGARRQDSVYNGLQQLSGNPLVCIHDAARPMIDAALVRQVVHAAGSSEAAVVGVKVKSTIKICNDDQLIVDTPQRSSLWEVQTPQVVRLDLLQEGFEYAQRHHLSVTDDVSLVELLGKPVKVVEGSYANIKLTTPEDFLTLEKMIEKKLACTATN
jgi:2-C-methyl-D-erythritol 4-phosphate cytidylyltransferase